MYLRINDFINYTFLTFKKNLRNIYENNNKLMDFLKTVIALMHFLHKDTVNIFQVFNNHYFWCYNAITYCSTLFGFTVFCYFLPVFQKHYGILKIPHNTKYGMHTILHWKPTWIPTTIITRTVDIINKWKIFIFT